MNHGHADVKLPGRTSYGLPGPRGTMPAMLVKGSTGFRRHGPNRSTGVWPGREPQGRA